MWRDKYPEFEIQRVNKEHYLQPDTDEGDPLLIPSAAFHYIPLPLPEGFAKLLVHWNCSLGRIPPLVVIFWCRAQLLEERFGVPFGYPEIVRYMSVT